MPCEDAPCCGCCGTNIYGVNQEASGEPEYCDRCGFTHGGDCPPDFDPEEDDDAYPKCPTCGEPSDYCLGHGVLG